MVNFDIKQLPKDILAQAKSTLHAYPNVHIWYNAQHKDFKVRTGTMLSAHDDGYRHVVSLTPNDVFTPIEQMENYINTFCSYPPHYQGLKDWGIIQKMQQDRVWTQGGLQRWVGKLNAKGDFVLTGKIIEK